MIHAYAFSHPDLLPAPPATTAVRSAQLQPAEAPDAWCTAACVCGPATAADAEAMAELGRMLLGLVRRAGSRLLGLAR